MIRITVEAAETSMQVNGRKDGWDTRKSLDSVSRLDGGWQDLPTASAIVRTERDLQKRPG